ncbi:MAG TPA: ABC transporter permease [Bacteroidales bacterium]
MFGNYFKIGLRILIRQRSYTLLNIAGLAIGIAVFVFIYLYIQSEISYDRNWSDDERIYRVTNEYSLEGKPEKIALTPFQLAESLQNEIPGVETATKLFFTDPSDVNDMSSVRYQEEVYEVADITLGDANVFKIFDYEFLEGNPDSALVKPNSIVISSEIAKMIFGQEKALGKTLSSLIRDYKVTGVFNHSGKPTHLNFDAVVSVNSLPANDLKSLKKDWFWLNCYTYIKIADTVEIASLSETINNYTKAKVDNYVDSTKAQVRGYYQFNLEAISDVHFNTKLEYDSPTNTEQSNLYIFGMIALFILLTASINYVNLAMARSLKRAKETGVRKVLGAYRKQLIMQHISESFIVTFIAFVFALSLVEFLMPQFNALVDKDLTLVGTLFSKDGILFGLLLIGMIVVLAFLSGSFPALILSSFRPVNILKGNNFFFSMKGKDRISTSGIRKILVTVQYFVSIGMIISTAIIYSQMKFLDDIDLGFDKKNILVINLPQDTLMHTRAADFITAIDKHPGIIEVSSAMNLPGYTEGKVLFRVGDTDSAALQSFSYFAVGNNYFNTLKIPLVEGSFFTTEKGSNDSIHQYIINEAAVEYLKLKNPIGSKLNASFFEDNNGEVVGVVKNFNYTSLHNKVEPLIFMLWPKRSRYLLAKIDENQQDAAFAHINKTWEEFNPGQFMHYTFLEDKIKSLYRVDQKMLSLFIYFSLFVIFISSLGLYGLSSLLIEQRTKEIGIRKVLGGSENQIIFLLSKDYLLLVLFAGLLVSPFVYFLMNQWLNTFAYIVQISGWYYFFGILSALVIAFLTVYVRSFNVVRNSPSAALKWE